MLPSYPPASSQNFLRNSALPQQLFSTKKSPIFPPLGNQYRFCNPNSWTPQVTTPTFGFLSSTATAFSKNVAANLSLASSVRIYGLSVKEMPLLREQAVPWLDSR